MTFCGLRFSVCGFPWKTSCDDIPDTFSIDFACLQIAFLFGEKIARRGKGKGGGGGGGGGGGACRQTFEASIPPSCNYLTEHLSVRSLSVNQY